MQTAADVILALEADSSRTKKEAIIKEAWNLGIIEFFEGAQMAYDSLRTFGVRKVPLIESDNDSNFVADFNWARFKKVAYELETRKLTGNMARDTLRSAANVADVKEWNAFYRRVLLKDLKCGITESTINKVLKATKDNTAEKYIIPVFSCQLAKNGEDHPKKLVGVKLLDPKLDGCLSSEWTVEFEDGKKVTIAEVVDNRINGKIKSFNIKTGEIEFNTITNWAKNGIDINEESIKWFKITLENGVVLPPLTGNHMIWLPILKCWRRVDLLKIGDKLLQDI